MMFLLEEVFLLLKSFSNLGLEKKLMGRDSRLGVYSSSYAKYSNLMLIQ